MKKNNKQNTDFSFKSNELAEANAISLLLKYPELQSELLANLTADHFYNLNYQEAWRAAIQLNELNQPINKIAIAQYISFDVSILLALENEKNVSKQLYKQTIQLLSECFQTREIQKINLAMLDETQFTTSKAAEYANAIEKISQGKPANSQEVANSNELMQSLLESFEQENTLIKTGVSIFDNNDYFKRSNLIILAARPAMGKTALSLDIMLKIAVNGYNCLFFSLEMSKVQIAGRLICNVGKIDNSLLKDNYKARELVRSGRLQAAKYTIESLDININDTGGLSISEMENIIIREHRKKPLDFIMVDYLQLCSLGKQANNREQEISEITRRMKSIAKKFDVPFLALSQLNRAVETRTNKRPTNSDLRESGAIEQDADVILFLYRPEYYGIMQDESGNPTANITEVICAKNRHGKTGTSLLHTDFSTYSYLEIENEKTHVSKEEFKF